MKTFEAQTFPSFIKKWVPISTYDHPRTFEQALADVNQALAEDKSPIKSPKRILEMDGDVIKRIVWPKIVKNDT